MHKFNIGDTVRIISVDSVDINNGFKIGDTLVIKNYHHSPIPSYGFNGKSAVVYEKDLELFEEKVRRPVKKSTTNDWGF